MFLNFKKLYIMISLKIIFSCFFYSNKNLASSSRDPLSFPSTSSSSSAPAPLEDQDPRMHVTSVALYEGEDVSWFDDVKVLVRDSKTALEEDRNTAFIRFGFLIQSSNESSQPDLVFPTELNASLGKICFISGFQHADSKNGIEFCSLKDIFPNDHYPDWKTYRSVLRGILELRAGQSPNLAKVIQRKEAIKEKIDFYDSLLSIENMEEIKLKMFATIPPPSQIIPADMDPLSEIRKAVKENPIAFIQKQKLEEQKKFDITNIQIADLRRLEEIDSAEWDKKFFHSEQAAHFYLMSYFGKKNKCGSVCGFLPKNLNKFKVNIVVDVCTFLNMCSNCARTYYIESQSKRHYMSNIIQTLMNKKITIEPILITRASCVAQWCEDPLPALTDINWSSPYIGHLSPS